MTGGTFGEFWNDSPCGSVYKFVCEKKQVKFNSIS